MSSPSPHVRRMLGLIHEQFHEHLSLRTLAQVIGRQQAYLGRLFHQETGVTVHDYIARYRMNHAAKLIQEGEKIEAVALEVGYRSKKNFYRQFTRQFGATPAVYRYRITGRLRSKLDTLHDVAVEHVTAAVRDPDDEPTPTMLRRQLEALINELVGSAAPTPVQSHTLNSLRKQVTEAIDQFNLIVSGDVPALNRILEQNHLPPIRVPTQITALRRA